MKLYKTLVDETWFLGERYNPKEWMQEPQTYTNWNTWFEEEFDTYNTIQNKLPEFEADAVEIRLCFIDIDRRDFLDKYGFDSLNLDCEEQQDALNYYVDFNWSEIGLRLIENPAYTDGEIVDITYTVDELA